MKTYTPILILFLILFFISGAIVINKNVQKNSGIGQKAVTDSFTEKTNFGKKGPVIALERMSDDQNGGNANRIVVGIRIDSMGENVSGFDVVLEYNPDEMFPAQFAPLENNYEIYTISKKGEYLVSGIRKLNGSKPEPLHNSIIGTVIFERKGSKKNSVIKIKFIPQNTAESNVINSESKDILTRVIDLSVD